MDARTEEALNQGFAHRANKGASEEEFNLNLAAGRDPFIPLGPGGNCAFHALVHGARPWCLPLAIQLAVRPRLPEETLPREAPSQDLITRMIRGVEPAKDIQDVHEALVKKGVDIKPLDEIAKQALRGILWGDLRNAKANDTQVASALRFVSLSPEELQGLWPSSSKALHHLLALMDAIPVDQRIKAMHEGLQGTTGWLQRALVAMAPTSGTGKLLDHLKGWAGGEGKDLLSKNAALVLFTAIRHAPRHAFVWVKKCRPEDLKGPWEEMTKLAGVSPWQVLLASDVEVAPRDGKKLLSRIRTAQDWIRRPAMGWEGAWEAWIGLATRLEDPTKGLQPRESLVEATARLGKNLMLGGALGALSPSSLSKFPLREPSLIQVLEAAQAAVLEAHMERSLSQRHSSSLPRSRPGRF